MKIAYVHTGKWPSNSPSFTFVTNNAIALASEFDECFLFVKNNSDKNSKEIVSENFDLAVPNNLFIERINCLSIINSNYFYYHKVNSKLKKLFSKNKIDVVITRNPTFLKYLVKIKIKYKTKVFFETHDFYSNLKLRDDINPAKKKHIEKIENKYIPKLDGVICLQNSQKELYEEKFQQTKIYLARTGLQKVNNINLEKNFVTYIGSLDKHKGVIQLIKAAALTKSKPKLLIIGGKTKLEIENIQKIVDKNYNKNSVKITGWVSKKELGEYLTKTAIGIVPLEETFFNKYLTSPLKLFDYFSFCIPVIATDLPTTRELIVENKTGLFFQNIDELANRIDELILNPNKIDEMRNEIFIYAQKYLWINRAKELREIFNFKSN
ncbi:MAG: glycosyltransferase [Melioribacteraceae bacterium]